LRESYDIDIEDSLEELNNYRDMTDLFKKKKVVVLKDNNKVPDYKVRKVMNEKLRYRPKAFEYSNSRNNDYKQLTPINTGLMNIEFTPD
jgi:transketolase